MVRDSIISETPGIATLRYCRVCMGITSLSIPRHARTTWLEIEKTVRLNLIVQGARVCDCPWSLADLRVAFRQQTT
jgi:hypothetical protein